jgi:hypothetical protein
MPTTNGKSGNDNSPWPLVFPTPLSGPSRKSIRPCVSYATPFIMRWSGGSMVPNTIAAERRRESSEIWPNITRQKPAPPDADAFVNVPDKYAKYFSPNPGERD